VTQGLATFLPQNGRIVATSRYCLILGGRSSLDQICENCGGIDPLAALAVWIGDDVIELLFAACLSADPNVCKDRSIWFIDTTQEQCQTGADAQLKRWLEVNPRWSVEDWNCAQVDIRAAKLN